VNREHLKAFIWLRWRLRANQFKKAGAVNAVFTALFAATALVAAVGLFAAGLMVGLLAMPQASPMVRLLVWDGVVVFFLFWWLLGLMADVQRTEALALDKFLTLPVSISGAFLVNYVSSLFSLTLLMFLPGMVGLLLGQLFSQGPAVLLGFPLLAGFMFALTALTYQFQGWLATLMANPRRRRTIIVLVTGGIILVAQTPQLINLAVRPTYGPSEASTWRNEQTAENARRLKAKQVTYQEHLRREAEINDEFQRREDERKRKELDRVHETARLLSTVIPPGWLPMGLAGLPDNEVLPALLGTLGFGLIGSASLWRAYRTTLRLYTGQAAGGGRRTDAPRAATPAVPDDPAKVRLLERKLPWVSEHAAAVALAAFRSLTRAPEAKMALLAPLIMIVVFAGIATTTGEGPPVVVRPLIAFGAGAGVLLICGAQLIGNQFGYDRGGFRAYVLSPVPRREILLGKNLAVAPLAVGLGAALLLLVGAVYPMRIDHYPAALAQLLSAFLVFAMLANGLSIIAPIPLKAGSLQAAQMRLVPVLLQFVFLAVIPMAMLPVLAPIGLEVLLAHLDVVHGLPVSLVLSLALLAVLVPVYRKVLTWEGQWLAAREQAILEVVVSKAE
jgi:ABC-2 type transport system permease protein